MRDSSWSVSRSVRKTALIVAILVACFVWTVTTFGLSIAMAKQDDRQWWLIPVFGMFMLLIALLVAHRVHVLLPLAEPEPSAVSDASSGTAKRVLAEPLSPREVEVLRHMEAGRSNREIAAALFIAPGTVKAHLNHMFRKLEATSRLQAVAHAREAGLLDPEIDPG